MVMKYGRPAVEIHCEELTCDAVTYEPHWWSPAGWSWPKSTEPPHHRIDLCPAHRVQKNEPAPAPDMIVGPKRKRGRKLKGAA